MKRFTLIALALLALPLAAAEVKIDNTVIPVGSAPELVIPAAGSIAGANGTYFKSDITILNYSNHAQTVRLRWLPQGQTGSNLTATDVTLSALSGITSEDFVATVLRQTGLGSILVSSITAGGARLLGPPLRHGPHLDPRAGHRRHHLAELLRSPHHDVHHRPALDHRPAA